MTKNEKIITEILYQNHIDSGSASFKYEDLVKRASGKLSEPEIANLFNNSRSTYFEWVGGAYSVVQITLEGIKYIENLPEQRKEENYKAIILVFAGVQVMIAVLQLIQSIVDSEFTAGKLISLTGLIFVAIFLWYFYRKTK